MIKIKIQIISQCLILVYSTLTLTLCASVYRVCLSIDECLRMLCMSGLEIYVKVTKRNEQIQQQKYSQTFAIERQKWWKMLNRSSLVFVFNVHANNKY